MVLGSRLGDGSRRTYFKVRNTATPKDAVEKVSFREVAVDMGERSGRVVKRDPFSGVRWMDRRKENAGYRVFPDAKKYSEHKVQRPNINTSFNRNDRKEYAWKFAPVVTQEFRVVRDKRSKKIAEGIIKPDFDHSSAISSKQVVFDASNNGSTGNVATSNHPTARGFVQENLPPILEGISDSHEVRASENKMADEQLMPELKLKDSNLSSTEDGGGARQAGVVGSQRQPCVHPNRRSTVGNGSYSIHLVEKDLLPSSESFGHTVFAPKSPNLYKIPGSESIFSNISTSKPFTANQHNCKPNQQAQALQKAMLSSKEWRPKSSQKSRVSSPRLHDSGGSIVSTELEVTDLSASFSKIEIFDRGHVIIPEHLQVPEAERTSFIFGSFEEDFVSVNIAKSTSGNESGDKRSLSVSEPISISSQEDRSNVIASLSDSNLASSQSDAFLLTTQGELAFAAHSESSSPKNIHSYVDINVVQRHEQSCSPPKSQQVENYPSTNCFFENDQQGRDCKPFPKAAMDEDDHGYSFSYEALGLNPAQQHQHLHPVPQLYPQVHTTQFTNFVPYRNLMATPMFVPQMPFQAILGTLQM
ncbi:hypothetical protein HPP92_009654 [Vanilla planifolia]|uniref:Uncharacterized protein n=1 Tax=Vanilla planifolia TaxID=51239 RepID=A0A835V6I3_VANPL|nr:hypothetical protein HPP92_009654 [Vanilla planifolia]